MTAFQLLSDYFVPYHTEIKVVEKVSSMIVAPFHLPKNVSTLCAKEYNMFLGKNVKTNLAESLVEDDNDIRIHFLMESQDNFFETKIYQLSQRSIQKNDVFSSLVDQVVLFVMALGSYVNNNELYLTQEMIENIKSHHANYDYFKETYPYCSRGMDFESISVST